VPSYDQERVGRIVEIEQRLRTAQETTIIQKLQRELDEAVYDLYELDDAERILVNDMVNVTISLKTKRRVSQAARKPAVKDLNAYAKQCVAVMQPFLDSLDDQLVSASPLAVGDAPLRVVRFSTRPTGTLPIADEPEDGLELQAVLARIARELPARIASGVYAERWLRIYAGEVLYVVKPAEYRYWTLAAALNDADAILAEHQEDEHDADYLEPPVAGRSPRPHQAVHTA